MDRSDTLNTNNNKEMVVATQSYSYIKDISVYNY